MNFILDTGVRTTILTEAAIAPFLGLDSVARVRVRGLGEGEVIQAMLARNVSFSLTEEVVGRGIQMVVLPEGVISYSHMFGKPVYGIIGSALFSQFIIEINYQHEYIRLYNPFEFKPKRKAVAVPFELRGGKPYIRATIYPNQQDSIQADWLLDTGASQAVALFSDEVAIPDPSIQAFLGQGLSGNVYGEMARVPSFKLGPFRFEDVITGFPDTSSLNLPDTGGQWYGNIGAEILSRFRVYFDYLNSQVYLKKTRRVKEPFDYNTSGIELISLGRDFDTFVIVYVRPESPAYKAGVRVNDVVLTLNGLEAKKLGIDEIYNNLQQREGKTIHLKLKRNDQTFKTKFRLESEI